MAGNDANTVLLLHGDGANGGTTFTDSSFAPAGGTPHSFTVGAGSPVTSTGAFKFGTASLSFPGSAYIITADSADWAFGTGDFTIDFWIKRSSVTSAAQNTFGQGNAGLTGGYHYGAITAANTFKFAMNDDGFTATGPASGLNDTNWHHIAIQRTSTNLAVAIDGTWGSSVGVSTTTYTDSTAKFGLGTLGEFTTTFFVGNIDEFRVSKGISRWTLGVGFTPPTAAYSAAYTLAAAVGSYALTGIAAFLGRQFILAAAVGAYALTGVATATRRGIRLAAAVGTYAITGIAARTGRGVRLTAAVGSYALTGLAARTGRSVLLLAAVGSYTITGKALALVDAVAAASKFKLRLTPPRLQKLRQNPPELSD